MIDTHIHVVPPVLPGVGSLHPALRQPPEAVAESLRLHMRAAGITHAFAMGALSADPADPLGIRKTEAIAALVPGLRPIGIMNPDPVVDDHYRRVESEIAAKRVVALKGYLGYVPREPSYAGYRPYYELAARYKIPVIFHTGSTYSPYAKLKFAQPLGVDEVAVDFPNVSFVLAQLGNPWMLEAAELVCKNINVWTDLSGLFVGDEAALTDEELFDARSDLAARIQSAFRYSGRPNRFIYGSDWPRAPMREYREFIASTIPPHFHEAVFEQTSRLLFQAAF